tara:strand:- start:2233 stop:2634 length:402 start_codon:yes stop_codon:yes gene_type:complete
MRIPIDVQLSMDPYDTMGMIMERVEITKNKELMQEIRDFLGNPNLTNVCFFQRMKDGTYLSVHENKKHVYWSDKKEMRQLFMCDEHLKIRSVFGTYISRIDNILWQILSQYKNDDDNECFAIRVLNTENYNIC